MKVNAVSPAKDQNSFAHQWDTASRKYFSYFEDHKENYRNGVYGSLHNPFTLWREQASFFPYMKTLDNLAHRQQLGEVSKKEVSECNSVHGGRYYFTKGNKAPASIYGWRWPELLSLWGLGTLAAGYGKFVKGYNILWFVGPYVPLWSFILYNHTRQPSQQLENCYKFILAKRSATCELEQHRGNFKEIGRAKSLVDYMKRQNITLLQVEHDLASRIHSGSLKAK
jgi:hypothetical protein